MNSPRLLTIAQLITNNPVSVIDVGSDHAYLSIYLISHHQCQRVTNVEVNQQPLENGLKNVTEAQLNEFIDFKLNNGLKDLYLPYRTDYVCISGMGASNIIEIIQNNTYQTPNYYVVQPNNDLVLLRKFLKQNNYAVTNVELVVDNKIYYEVYKFEPSQSSNLKTDVDIYVAPIHYININQLQDWKTYLLQRYHHLSKMPMDKVNLELRQEFKILKEYLYKKKWIS